MLVVGSCRATFAGTGGHVWTFLHSRCDSLLDDHYEIKMRRMTMMMMDDDDGNYIHNPRCHGHGSQKEDGTILKI